MPAWSGARPKAPSMSLVAAPVSSPSPSRETVLTVEEARDLINQTTDALEKNQREAIAICGKLFEPLQQFIALEDMAMELPDCKKEIADLKVVNSHLTRLQSEVNYHKEIAAVQAAAQGLVQPHPGIERMVVNQVRRMLDSLAGSYKDPVQQF